MKNTPKILSTAIVVAMASMAQQAMADGTLSSIACGVAPYNTWTTLNALACEVNLANLGGSGWDANDLTDDNNQAINIGTTTATTPPAGRAWFQLVNPNTSTVAGAAASNALVFGTPIDIYFAGATALTLNITGTLDLQGGDDILTNIVAGVVTPVTVNGNLNTGAGNDTANLEDAIMNGDVSSGAGRDTLTFTDSQMTGNIDSDGGRDTMNLLGTTSVIGNIFSRGGIDTMLIQGDDATNRVTVTGNINGGGGSDLLDVSYATINGNITMGNGNDGDGDDVRFRQDAIVNGRIVGNNGDDTTHIDDNASIDNVFMDDPAAVNPVGVANGVTGNAGTDNLWINGANVQLDAAMRLDGGDDVSDADGLIDQLHFNGWSGTAPTLTNWERINLTNAAVIVLPRDTTAGTINIAAGTTLRPMDDNSGADVAAYNITANVVNNGTLTYQDGATNDTPQITGDYSGNGQLLLDIDTSDNSSDVLTINGDNTGTINIVVNNLGATSNWQNIPLVTVTGATGNATVNGGNTYTGGGVNYQLQLLGNTWTLVPVSRALLGGATQPVPATGLWALLTMVALMLGGVFTRQRQSRN